MSGEYLRVEGLEELNSKLASLPLKIEKKIVTQALDQFSEDLSDLIRQAAPVGKEPHHGQYKELPQLRFSVEASNMNTKEGTIQRKIIADYYARFVEFGHNVRGSRQEYVAKSGSRKGYQAYNAHKLDTFVGAQAFVEPTVRAAEEGLFAELLEKIADDIEAQASSD